MAGGDCDSGHNYLVCGDELAKGVKVGSKKRTAIAALCVSGACLAGIAGYEGYRGRAYQDSGGVWTVGYGETKGVKPGERTTPERALVQLLKSTEAHADGIRSCIHVPLYQHEWDALVSFAYNTGIQNFCRSTLVKKLNMGDYQGAADEMPRWDKVVVKGKKRVLNGLSVRRACERQYFLGQTHDMARCREIEERKRGKK